VAWSAPVIANPVLAKWVEAIATSSSLAIKATSKSPAAVEAGRLTLNVVPLADMSVVD